MAEAYDKGKKFEELVAKMVRLKVDGGATRNKASHANWNRRSDIFTNLPLHIEAKHHEKIAPREWYAQATAAASFSQIPIVAFSMNEKVMALVELDNMLDLYMEIADLKVEIEDLHKPVAVYSHTPTAEAKEAIEKIVEKAKTEKRVTRLCRAGHISDEHYFCMQKGCKYARGYRPPKAKGKK